MIPDFNYLLVALYIASGVVLLTLTYLALFVVAQEPKAETPADVLAMSAPADAQPT